ncbi:hypothetical protein SCHPADRAFT_830650, partial [Schizopora paradoxa]
MALPAQIPTLIAHSTKNLTRVDNVFISETAMDDVVYCNAQPEERPVKTDHFPVRTIIECQVPRAQREPRRNFRSVEWKDFVATLRAELARTGGAPGRVRTVEELTQLYARVMQAIETTIEEHVPMVKESRFQKLWWAPELLPLAKQKRTMQRRAYRW